MTPAEREAQRDRVRASELLAASRADRRDAGYTHHPLSRAVPQGQPTIGSDAQSIRELGEMLVVAERHPVFRERMEEIERLAERVGQRLDSLRAEIRAEYLRAMI